MSPKENPESIMIKVEDEKLRNDQEHRERAIHANAERAMAFYQLVAFVRGFIKSTPKDQLLASGGMMRELLQSKPAKAADLLPGFERDVMTEIINMVAELGDESGR